MVNEGEFVSKHLLEWFTDSSIMPQYSPPYSPESNGQDERLKRTISDKERVKVNGTGPAHKNVRAEVIDTASYIRNRMFIEGCQREGIAPNKALTGITPDVFKLRRFGCTASVNIPS